MADLLPVLARTGAVALASAAAGLGYAAVVERNAFVLRETTMPVLPPGSTSLRVLHISDLHMMPNQRRKQAWVRELAGVLGGRRRCGGGLGRAERGVH